MTALLSLLSPPPLLGTVSHWGRLLVLGDCFLSWETSGISTGLIAECSILGKQCPTLLALPGIYLAGSRPAFFHRNFLSHPPYSLELHNFFPNVLNDICSQCSKVRVHPTPDVHNFAAGCPHLFFFFFITSPSYNSTVFQAKQ